MTRAAPASMPDVAPPADDPAAYVAEDRRRALASGSPVDGLVSGSVLFADVSGFTSMTEAMVTELGEQRGAEVLAATLERVFGELIGELHRWSGSVVYFSGDAVTCWLQDDDGSRAAGCGLAMQGVMDRVGTVTTPRGSSFRLQLKVAVAAGEAHRFVAGDPAIQLIDVLAGSLMDEVAAAEAATHPHEVVVTRAVLGRLPPGVALEERTPGVVIAPWPGAAEPPGPVGAAVAAPELPEEVTRQWLLPDVYRRMRAGRGEFLAELRPAVPVFVRFGGLDFDEDPSAPQRLDAFVVAVQRVVDGHGGNVLQLTVGDKGAYLYAVFGAPIAHEDDAARACAAGLEVADLAVGDVVDVTVGIASGRLRSGTYGNRGRRTFCCLGDAVNLAARLMGKAEPRTVLVSGAVAGAAGDRFRYGERRNVALKGRSRGTDAFVVLGRREQTTGVADGGIPPVVGRAEEIALVVGTARAAACLPTEPSVTRLLGVTGDVGAGKSRLLAEAANVLRQEGVRTVEATAPVRGVVPAYAGWWPVWRTLLGVGPQDDAAEVLARLEGGLPDNLRPRLPLLGALLGVPLPENDLTDSLDAKLRKSSLEQLALEVLLDRAAGRPLVLVLDDAHALDPLSRDLLVEVARSLERLPVGLVLAYRPGDEPLLGLELDTLTRTEEVSLGTLPPEETRALAAQVLEGLFHAPAVDALVGLVVERSNGNPLWVRELCRFLHDRSEDDRSRPPDEADLPDTLQGLVLGRLDLLDETSRRTAKVASVVGRRFTGDLVHRAWPNLGTEGEVRTGLQELARRGLTTPADPTADTWSFTHGVLRDVAYESLPLATRTTVHDAVAVALESGEFGDVDRHLDDLAHHAWHGGDQDRQRIWLRRAGESAQADYANDTALLHYRRLLTVVPEAERPDVQIRVGKVLELQVQWDEAGTAYEAAREVALAVGDTESVGWATTWLADVARKRRRYEEAQQLLDEAESVFAGAGARAGAAQVWHVAGTLASQQGRFDEAATLYRRSLEVRQQLGDQAGAAALLSNLAIGAEAQGDYENASVLANQALAIRREIGDRWAVGVSQNNLGMLALLRGDAREAHTRFTESMTLHAEVGDPWMVALGHHNLGNAQRDLGEHDLARDSYLEALAAYRRFEDEWVLALLYEDAALLLAATHEHDDAWRLVGASDRLHDRTGSPRTPDVTVRLEQALSAGGRVPIGVGAPGDPSALVNSLRAFGASLTDAELHRLMAGPHSVYGEAPPRPDDPRETGKG